MSCAVLYARKMQKLLGFYRGYVPLREHGKYFLMKLFSLMRHEIVHVSELFTAQSVLADSDDVWFLEYNELLDLVKQIDEGPLSDPENLHELRKIIEHRKEHFTRFLDIEPPRVILGNGHIPRPSYSTEGMPEGAMAGMGVSSGEVEGRARVILDPESDFLRKGEILVAPFTDPAWTPLFINAAAVVIEVGGKMTHGSVIAREYGIPAVVSLPDVTTIIETGQKLRVNGSKGCVQLLKE